MSWTVEERFLLHIAVGSEEPFPHPDQIDPDLLLDISLKEGMQGFVYRWFHKAGFPAVFSDAWRKELEQRYFTVFARNMLLKENGHALLASLSREKIPVLLIQGFPMLDGLYSDYGLRPLCDMDLLFPESFLGQAKEVLRQKGLESFPDFPSVFSRDEFVVDLHRDILNVTRIEERKEYVNLKFEDLEGRYTIPLPEYHAVYKLKPEAAFPLLAAHLTKHSFSRMIWFADLFKILTSEEARLNPEEMVAVAKRWNLLPTVLIPALFIRECFKFPLPECLQREITKNKTGKKIIARMVINNNRSGGIGNYFMASQLGGFGHTIKFAWEFCFPKKEVMAQIYPEWEGNLIKAYFARFVNLCFQTTRTVFKR